MRRAWEFDLLVNPRDVRAGCIRFDEGHRTSKGYFGNLVRNSVWLVAVVLLLILLVVNARYMTDPTLDWETLRFSNKRLGIYSLSLAGGANGVHALQVSAKSRPPLPSTAIEWSDSLDFVSWALLVLFSMYTGLSLWRYGTSISTDVRVSCRAGDGSVGFRVFQAARHVTRRRASIPGRVLLSQRLRWPLHGDLRLQTGLFPML